MEGIEHLLGGRKHRADRTPQVWSEDVSHLGFHPGQTVYAVRANENGRLRIIAGTVVLYRGYHLIEWFTPNGTRDMYYLNDAFSKLPENSPVFGTREAAVAAAHKRVDLQHDELEELLREDANGD